MAKQNSEVTTDAIVIEDAKKEVAPSVQSRKWQLKNNAVGLQIGANYIDFKSLSDNDIDDLIKRFPQIVSRLEKI
jgi:hypothetical protein